MALKTFYSNFRGEFCNPDGVKYSVHIETNEKLFPTSKTIRLGATPFVVDCDADENYFKPVRTRTAKLTIIDEDGTLHDQIMPNDNFSTKVIIYTDYGSGNFSEWFVSCEVFVGISALNDSSAAALAVASSCTLPSTYCSVTPPPPSPVVLA